MDATSFLFVASLGGQRRVVAGDCDPYVCLMTRVSEQPLDDDELARQKAEYSKERQQHLSEQAQQRQAITPASGHTSGQASGTASGPGRLRLDPAPIEFEAVSPRSVSRWPWPR